MKNFVLVVSLLTSLLVAIPFKALAVGETLSPNMNLIVPAVGITSGPQWAADIDMTLGLIDSHDHSPGHGVQITSSGLNINSSLSYQGHPLTNLGAASFTAQSVQPVAGSVYMSGVDLYFVDLNGNNIRLTQSSSIAGAAGSISGLVAPASASYIPTNATFLWQSGSSTAASADIGCLVQRDLTPGSNAITLCPPANLSSNFPITWPGSLPGSSTVNVMTMDSGGNIGDLLALDNSTLGVSSNTLIVKNGGITRAQQAPLGQQTSGASGGFTTTSATFVQVTNLSVTITTTGRPVMLMLKSDSGLVSSYISADGGSASVFAFFEGSTNLGSYAIGNVSPTPGITNYIPANLTNVTTLLSAGTHTINFKMYTVGGGTGGVQNAVLMAYEL